MVTGNPIMMWGWNGKLDAEVLCAQMDEMKKQGVRAAMPHPRIGLSTEYFGSEWWECFDAVVRHAQEIGLRLWLYDEKGWPSGFGGGALLKDNRFPVAFLEYAKSETFDPSAYASFVRSGNGFVRVSEKTDAGEYFHVYRRYNDTYVDLLNPAATDAFIEHTYRGYYERYAPLFGSTIVGIFTDEPQYYRWATPFTDMLEKEFYAAYGYDFRDKLILLFEDGEGYEKFRYDYYRMLSGLYTANYIKRVYDWCSARGVVLSGHSVEEMNFSGQIACCGDVMPFYEYEHIPGIDWLSNVCGTDLSAKQCVSVARQTGKRDTMVEIFAVSGWNMPPRRLRQLYASLAVDGIDIIFQSIWEYSLAGEGKRDYPIDFSALNPWKDCCLPLNEYFYRLGELIANTDEAVPVLVIHPLRSGYLRFTKADPDAANAEYRELIALVRYLEAHRIPYHFGDEGILEKYGRVDGDKFRVGNCVYDAVVLPRMSVMAGSTYRLLQEFGARGGKICADGPLPQRLDGTAAELSLPLEPVAELCRFAQYTFTEEDGSLCADVKSSLREDKEGNVYLFAVNLSETQPRKMRLVCAGRSGAAEVDLLTGKEKGLAMQSLPVAAGGVHLFRLTAEKTAAAEENYSRTDILDGWSFAETPNNILVLDRARVSENGGPFSEHKFINDIRKQLFAREYCGDLALQYTFECRALPSRCELVAEVGTYSGICVNGTEVRPGRVWRNDRGFLSCPVAQYLRPGANEITLRLQYRQAEELYRTLKDPAKMESVKNAVFYDTLIENIYLEGDFSVWFSGGYAAAERGCTRGTGEIWLDRLPEQVRLDGLTKSGFPFFSGALRLCRSIPRAGGKTMLSFRGSVPCAKLFVNGSYAGDIWDETPCDITDKLSGGENRVELLVYSQNRNIFGPFHIREEEDYTAPVHYEITSENPGFSGNYLLMDWKYESAALLSAEK